MPGYDGPSKYADDQGHFIDPGEYNIAEPQKKRRRREN
jgi:hypothetical protein